MDDQEFQLQADRALTGLTRKLAATGDQYGFDADLDDGALKIEFDEPPGRFVISPNSAVRQIWISALVKSFKLDWDPARPAFVLTSTGQSLDELTAELISTQLGETIRI